MNTIQRHAVYCITDERVLVFILTSQPRIKAVGLSSLADFDVDEISANCGNVYIGKKEPSSLRRSRTDTLTFPGDNEQPLRPFVLYNVEDPYKIAALLRS